MGQVLHGCARTTAAVRRAMQHSQKSLNVAEQYEVNPKTVAKWKKLGGGRDRLQDHARFRGGSHNPA
jgi:hypothetical protein